MQIVCYELFEIYKYQNEKSNPPIEFGKNLLKSIDTVEGIIADYLSESMLEGLTAEERIYAQNILELLTGPAGLRTFLSIKEISRYLDVSELNARHVIEHLIKKKITHAVIEDDIVVGYELVHDFLSKKFFEKLGPDAKKAKTTIEIFRKAFREWKQHDVLASKDRLEILYSNYKQLTLNEEEWTFLIKSSFSVYWNFENKWRDIVDKELLYKICFILVKDKETRIVEHSISALGFLKNCDAVPTLIDIILSQEQPITVRDSAISQFSFNIKDIRIISVLEKIISSEKSSKLRKSAIYAFGSNIKEILNPLNNIMPVEISVLYGALNDTMTEVRKQVADVLGYLLPTDSSVEPLIARLEIEPSISSRKSMVSSLCALMRKGFKVSLVIPVLEKVILQKNEDYRVREEAKNGLDFYKSKDYEIT